MEHPEVHAMHLWMYACIEYPLGAGVEDPLVAGVADPLVAAVDIESAAFRLHDEIRNASGQDGLEMRK